jgi:hypothetical protein
MKHAQRVQVFLILSAFALAGFYAYRSTPGDDLSSSYLGCRVLAAHQPDHLYSHDPASFDRIDDPVWNGFVGTPLFKTVGRVHPYVQTPLWAYAIEPLCTHTGFSEFRSIFLALEVTLFSALLWLVASAWTPQLLHPGWMAVIAFAFWISGPVRYSLQLVQTHILFLFPAVLALVLAGRYPWLAGALLAAAAEVKITPGYLFLYWILVRRYKAALSFLACSVGLVLITGLTTGWALYNTYLQNLSTASNVLLVAYNNQSLAAWAMGFRYTATDLNSWQVHPLPAILRAASVLLTILASVAGGLLDRKWPDGPPFGAVFALIACTIFAPIAWSHYFFLLVIPCMMLAAGLRARRSLTMMAILSLAIALNVVPRRYMQGNLHVVRPQFYAAALSLAALVLLRRRANEMAGLGQSGEGQSSAAA